MKTNFATQVFNNKDLMKHIYEFDNTYHIIYQNILDDCYSAYKEFWTKKLNKLKYEHKNSINYNEILQIFKYNYKISSKYS
jgi:hypothetical protein